MLQNLAIITGTQPHPVHIHVGNAKVNGNIASKGFLEKKKNQVLQQWHLLQLRLYSGSSVRRHPVAALHLVLYVYASLPHSIRKILSLLQI